MCLRRARQLNRFESASGQGHVFASPCKGKAILLGFAVDANQVTRANLVGGQQIGKRVDGMALDSALQVACTVTLVSPLSQQEVARRWGDCKQELPLCCV